MPLNYEELVIRILTDSTQAMNDMDKVDRKIDKLGNTSNSSAKKIAAMGAAFGGVTLAIDIAVKAVAGYIKKIQDAEKAYIDYSKETRAYYDETANALIALDELKAQAQIEDGKRHAQQLKWWTELKTKRLEATVGQKELNDYIYQLWDISVQAAQAAGTNFKSLAKFTEDYKKSLFTGTDATDFWMLQAKGAADVAARTPLVKKSIDEINAANKKASDDYIAQNIAESQAVMDAAAERAQAVRDQSMIEYNLGIERDKWHQEELARTAAEVDARKQAATDILNSLSDMYGAIGNLIYNRYQAEIDAAEDGSAKQKELMKKQFNAEKAMAITQSLIATAVGITKAIPNIPLMIFSAVQGAIQTAAIAATRPPQFAVGTSPSGYTVPQGHPGDTYPVMARSGEKVSIQTPASPGEAPAQINLVVDGRVFGSVMTNMFGNRYATVPAGVVVR